MKHLAQVAACLVLAAGLCRAQSGASPTAPEKSSESTPHEKKAAAENAKLFGIMPNYGTIYNAADARPMTAGDKFKLASRYFNLYTVGFVAFRAGVDQAVDSKDEYGQGAQGYGKRFGADFADGLSNSFFVTAVFPSLLHQDPRYYRRGEGSGFSRMAYAASRVLITRQDSGRKMFNFSEVSGNAASSGLSTAYYPDNERTAGDFAVRAGIQIAYDAGFNILKEFYPDLEKKFRKKHKPPAGASQP